MTQDGTFDGYVTPRATTVVELQEQAWRARADAARSAAEELRRCKRGVAATLTYNYFGQGCVEGEALYKEVHAALFGNTGWASQLDRAATELETLAVTCANAGNALTAQDTQSAATLTVDV